jgi:hypothetical protein
VASSPGTWRFDASALADFLRRVDRELTEPTVVMMIGGSAVALIDASHTTTDVDLLSPGSTLFDAAVARIQQRGESVLPVQTVGIADVPDGTETRATPATLGTTRLTVLIPEQHDLAMMKLGRGYEHDLQALEDIHRKQPFSIDVLVERFKATEVIGPRRWFALAFLDLVARLFGEEEANRRRKILDGLTWSQ